MEHVIRHLSITIAAHGPQGPCGRGHQGVVLAAPHRHHTIRLQHLLAVLSIV